ncbi:hypothetical protein [Sphingobium sp. EM0848]|uniref:hypothetical protein n=1 Tax=Sphingobium sp. EM0848 TaxID=2743473 RepID=UPI00159C3611|nr:hypothetical protein [Sphingobium sp. EM0848]
MNCLIAATMGVAFLHGLVAVPAYAEPEPPGAVPVADSMLEQARGMADIRIVEQTATTQNSSSVQGNSITGDFTTGMVNLGNGALDNFNGLALFSINTGNNVAINSSMTVNVAIQP